MILIAAFIVGLMLGPVAAVLVGAFVHWRRANALKVPTPVTLDRDWRMWREDGVTYLELTERVLNPDGPSFYSSFTVRYPAGTMGEELWAARVDQRDRLADATHGNVALPVGVE